MMFYNRLISTDHLFPKIHLAYESRQFELTKDLVNLEETKTHLHYCRRSENTRIMSLSE